MHRFSLFSLCLFFSLLITPAQAQNYVRDNGPSNLLDNTLLTAGIGYREDNLDWNIASDLTGTATPNILSELTWENIGIIEFRGRAEHTLPTSLVIDNDGIYVDAELSYGLIVSGENQDSDYLGNNRTLEFSRSNNSSDEGWVAGGKVTLGYQITRASKNLRGYHGRRGRTYYTFTPIAGYTWDTQNLVMQDGFQTIPALGAFGGLDSSYDTIWQGPFVGLKLGMESGRSMFGLRGEYHILDYEAEAVWNLRNDFMQDPSFEHTGDGDGFRIEADYTYAIDSRTAFTLNAYYQQRQIEDGLDELYFSNGTISRQRLNEVNTDSTALHVGMRHTW